MLLIDGSIGEGGGQVLRTALSLSMLTGQPIHMINIRAGRQRPGLQPQHLTAVQASAAVCGGQVRGAAINSQQLFFEPGLVRASRYRFDIGTAGSAPLVVQALYLPLAKARDTTTLTITGGTHVPFSPSYHYLEKQWLPVAQSLGFWMRLKLERAGFYPEGGGEIQAHIRPADEILPLERLEPGKLVRIRGISASANLREDIARRQKLQALRRLQPVCADSKIETLELPSPGKGTMLLLQAEFEHSTCCYFSLGAPGKRAEQVADEAADQLEACLASGGALDEFLADQLVLPLVLASGPSRFRTSRVTRHLLTQAALIPMFLPAQVSVEGGEGQPGTVSISPSGPI
jgi:RNA 3'-terminal phosphate cyclase (ATP)